jgi:hypothetical protein
VPWKSDHADATFTRDGRAYHVRVWVQTLTEDGEVTNVRIALAACPAGLKDSYEVGEIARARTRVSNLVTRSVAPSAWSKKIPRTVCSASTSAPSPSTSRS